MVFKSRRQSRLTVATMFLARNSCSVFWWTRRTARVYSLQRRDNATPRVASTRSRSWSCGRHPVAIRGISSLLQAIHISIRTLTINGHVSLLFRGWRRQVTGTAGEGQRSGRSEGHSLLRIRRVGRERVHGDRIRHTQAESQSRLMKQDEVKGGSLVRGVLARCE